MSIDFDFPQPEPDLLHLNCRFSDPRKLQGERCPFPPHPYRFRAVLDECDSETQDSTGARFEILATDWADFHQQCSDVFFDPHRNRSPDGYEYDFSYRVKVWYSDGGFVDLSASSSPPAMHPVIFGIHGSSAERWGDFLSLHKIDNLFRRRESCVA